MMPPILIVPDPASLPYLIPVPDHVATFLLNKVSNEPPVCSRWVSLSMDILLSAFFFFLFQLCFWWLDIQHTILGQVVLGI